MFFPLHLLHRWQNRGRTSRGLDSWVLLSPTITSQPTEGLEPQLGHSDGPLDCRRNQIEMQTHTNSSLKNNICILCMPTITEVKRASKCWHIIFDIVPYLWHNHCLMGDKLCPFSRSEHFFTACLYTPSVNDWPCTAHICQCSVSVPDRSRVMLK